jgi:type I restriction enzyme S subunit
VTLPSAEVIKAPAREWRPYPEYRDSGIEWLGEIPAHWTAVPLKNVAPFVSRGNSPDYVEESCIPVINQACVYWNELRLENVKYQREGDISNWKGLLREDDLLINSTGTGTLGRAAIFDREGIYLADSHVTIVRVEPGRASISFLCYLIQTSIYQGFVYSALTSGSTNQIELSREGLRAMPLVYPPLPEQRAIAAFLDRETAKVDEVIGARERLIGLLLEKRAALISRAVTRGLDPDAPKKDSGVEWLGEIPAHWEVKRLKHLVDDREQGIQIGPFGGMLKNLRFVDTGFKVYGQENIISNNFGAGSRWVTSRQFEEMAAYAVSSGDLLLTRKGSIGKCRVVPEDVAPGIIDSDTIRVRPDNQKVLMAYLTRLMHEAWYLQEQVTSSKRGAILSGLNSSTIAELQIVVPPLHDQRAITEYLDRETARIDGLAGRVREHVERLKEWRAALISAAVTGKVDVREGAGTREG